MASPGDLRTATHIPIFIILWTLHSRYFCVCKGLNLPEFLKLFVPHLSPSHTSTSSSRTHAMILNWTSVNIWIFTAMEMIFWLSSAAWSLSAFIQGSHLYGRKIIMEQCLLNNIFCQNFDCSSILIFIWRQSNHIPGGGVGDVDIKTNNTQWMNNSWYSSVVSQIFPSISPTPVHPQPPPPPPTENDCSKSQASLTPS